MARLLYRLGQFSARRAWYVIVGWIVILALGGGAYLAFGGALNSNFSIPGTATQKVTDHLADELPDLAGSTATVTFQTDGTAFTDSQRTAISGLLTGIGTLGSVAQTVDPFDTEQQLADSRKQLADSAQDIVDGKQQLADGQRKLDDGKREIAENEPKLEKAAKQLKSGQRQLDAGKAKLDASQTTIDENRAKLDASQKTIDKNRRKLAASQRTLDENKAQLTDAKTQLDEALASGAIDQAAYDSGIAPIDAGLQQIRSGQRQLDAGKTKLKAGQRQLDAGLAELNAAQAKVTSGLRTVAEKQAEITAGKRQVASGRKAIEQAKRKLVTGQQTIDENTRKLADGEAELAVGQRLLADSGDGATMVSSDGTTALGTIVLKHDFFSLEQDEKDAIIAKLDAAQIAGVTLHYSSTLDSDVSGIVGPGELIGVLLALIVLLVMLRAFLPAFLPIVTSLLGVGAGIVIVMSFSGIVQMSSVTPALGVMLGLAVGIDYALFIVNRHRRELSQGTEVLESIGLAVGTAGSAVVFAGATVAVALLGLLLTGVPFLGTMGIAAAFCVIVAVLMAVTFVPAFLGLIRLRALDRWSRKRIAVAKPRAAAKPMRLWVAIASVVVGVVGLLVVASPALTMRLALLDDASSAVTSESYQTYKIVDDEFGPGRNSPLIVVADLSTPVNPDDSDTGTMAAEAGIADFLKAFPDVDSVLPAAISDDGTTIALEVTPGSGSTDQATDDLVAALRSATPPSGVATLGVAGSTSAAMDISQKLADALPLYLVVIVLIAIFLLIAVFRSILVPIIATLGFVLSLFASLGVVTAVYQWGWFAKLFDVHDPGPVLAFAPILLIGMLFGLAMDYQLFLVTGMREAYVHGASARVAVISGRQAGRAVVTAAAIIMASVFGGFVFSELGMIRPLGMGLATGVLFDAFVVRMVIIPGVMHLLGKAAWWLPKWLDRLIPDIDIEGAALERAHHVVDPAVEAPEPVKEASLV